jgi:hypothetical protein
MQQFCTLPLTAASAVGVPVVLGVVGAIAHGDGVGDSGGPAGEPTEVIHHGPGGGPIPAPPGPGPGAGGGPIHAPTGPLPPAPPPPSGGEGLLSVVSRPPMRTGRARTAG